MYSRKYPFYITITVRSELSVKKIISTTGGTAEQAVLVREKDDARVCGSRFRPECYFYEA